MDDFAVTIKEIEQREKSNSHRIDKIEQKQDEISKKTEQIPVIRQTVEFMNEKLDKLESLVTDIKEKPAKRWEEIVTRTLCAVFGGVIAYVFAKLGL